MHAKHEVSISNGPKVKAKVKVDNRQTDRQTNRQTNKQADRQNKNNMPPIIRSGGIKNKAKILQTISVSFSLCINRFINSQRTEGITVKHKLWSIWHQSSLLLYISCSYVLETLHAHQKVTSVTLANGKALCTFSTYPVWNREKALADRMARNTIFALQGFPICKITMTFIPKNQKIYM